MSEIVDAANLLYRHRHTLPNDVLRSIQSIYDCASAARFGERYEAPADDDFYREHDTAECEAGDNLGDIPADDAHACENCGFLTPKSDTPSVCPWCGNDRLDAPLP
jgi:rubrerythrin